MITERMQQLAGVPVNEGKLGLKKGYVLDAYDELSETNFPYKVPHSYKILGEGTQGVVFDIGGGKILKITFDETEAKASSLIAKKNLTGIWKVEAVYETARFSPNMWFIIGENLSEDKTRALDAKWILDEFEENSKKWDKNYFEYAVDTITNPNPEHKGNWSKPDNVILKFEKNSNGRKDAIELATGMHNLNKLGISFQDLHPGNIMFRGNKAVIVDLGYSKSAWGNTKTFENTEYIGYRGREIEPGPYYHGTSTALDIKDSLKTPLETGKQTERRTQRRGKVFFTNNLASAKYYASVAVRKWGGNPIVYEVEPFGRVKQMSSKVTKYGPAFHADGAKVIKKL